MRDIAQFHLVKQNVDVAEFYRVELQRDPESLIALQGLSETGGIQDEHRYLIYAKHRFPRRRLAALHGLSRIKESIFIMLF